ncbi:MAG: response regulator transcription factor [Lachnospiraceae bacterium]|nr:response regulator transcription factor [Lachnospiraceae bacterium]MDE6055741.1 response regulator transcription factor [Lachnospiraceae bacterium]MDE7418579.1 response regulator transcription factor [Lachnospiraceae bacterium]
MIRIMIVDDHKMFREGLTKLIEFDEEIKVVEEADDGLDCINKLRSAKPDMILLDINMSDMDGIETLKELNHRKHRPKVIMLTVHNEIEYLIKVLDLGVEGYILKDSSSKELIRAIRFVYNGERFIQPSLIPLLNSKLIARDMDREKMDSLTNREMEILKLVALGHFNKDIASILSITERTVKNHLTSVFQKIDCADRTQAAIFCIRNGVVSVHE